MASLFEFLPPSSETKNEEESAPKSTRQRVTEPVVVASANRELVEPALKSQPSSKATTTRTTDRIPPQKVAEQAPASSSNFYLITAVLLCFSIATALFGYKIGSDHGFAKGAEYGASLRSKKQNVISLRKSNVKKTSHQKNTHLATFKTKIPTVQMLPTTVQKLTKEQRRVVTPKSENKRYTIQLQTFGRHNHESTKSLVDYLKEAGIDAFANYKSGVVFAGRFSSRNSASKALQKRIARFNWKNRNFKESFFQRIPTSLLKDNN